MLNSYLTLQFFSPVILSTFVVLTVIEKTHKSIPQPSPLHSALDRFPTALGMAISTPSSLWPRQNYLPPQFALTALSNKHSMAFPSNYCQARRLPASSPSVSILQTQNCSLCVSTRMSCLDNCSGLLTNFLFFSPSSSPFTMLES